MRERNVLDQTCTTEGKSLCGGWLFVTSWWFRGRCLPKFPLPVGRVTAHIDDQRYGSKTTKGRIPDLESGICKSESISQLNVQRNL